MATDTIALREGTTRYTRSQSERLAGVCGILAGIAGFGYAIAFIVLKSTLLSGLFLLSSGLLTSMLMAGVYTRIRTADDGLAIWALLLSVVGALGAAIHGGYDLANSIHLPAGFNPDLPNPIDPRGLLTFGISGIATLAVARLIRQEGSLPRNLIPIGYALSILLILLYLGRLIVLDPTNMAIVIPALLTGFIVSPLWSIRLGSALLNGTKRLQPST